MEHIVRWKPVPSFLPRHHHRRRKIVVRHLFCLTFREIVKKKQVFYCHAGHKRFFTPSLYGVFFILHLNLDYDYMYSETDFVSSVIFSTQKILGWVKMSHKRSQQSKGIENHEEGMEFVLLSPLAMKARHTTTRRLSLKASLGISQKTIHFGFPEKWKLWNVGFA